MSMNKMFKSTAPLFKLIDNFDEDVINEHTQNQYFLVNENQIKQKKFLRTAKVRSQG